MMAREATAGVPDAMTGRAHATDRYRAIRAGLLAGAVVGLGAGVAARVAMRLVALAGDRTPELTVAGTITVLLNGIGFGLPGGLLFVALRDRLPGPERLRGVTYGLFLLLAVGPLFFLADQVGELHVAPLAGIVLFSLIFLTGGIAIAATVARFERALPAAPRRPATRRLLIVLAALVCLGILPSLITQIILAARRVASFLP